MNKTKIEYVDFTANPITGKCPHGCSYCYAERMRKRFKRPEKMEWKLSVMEVVEKRHKPTTIFVGSAFDIFANEVPGNWIKGILFHVKRSPQHTFLFLTKNLKRYHEFNFPNNCWLGVSDSGNGEDFDWDIFNEIKQKKWISCEPLTSPQTLLRSYSRYLQFDWLVVGGLTPKPVHKKEWVQSLRDLAWYKNIPIFMKSNLRPIWDEKLIQEIPF